MSFFLRMPNQGFGFIFILVWLFLIGQPVPAQQVTQEWERRYDSAILTFESGARSAVDATGNTYVAANSRTSIQESSINNDGYVIAKFSPIGEVLWQHRFPFFLYPHAVVDVALDETGFYVVVSTVDMGSRTMVNVVKYALVDGQLLWQQGETPGSTMTGIQVLADNRGGIVLVGSVFFEAPGDYSRLYKYDASSGERLWLQDLSRKDMPPGYATLAGMALDSQGDIYLTGSTKTAENSSQMLTSKRSGADGALVWFRQYDTPLQDRAMQLAVDEAGGVYTWGVHYASDPSQPISSTLLKYDAATGRQVWRKRMEGAAMPEQLVADEVSGLYLLSSWQGQNLLARHSAATGSVRWSTTFAGTGVDMVADEAGNLYLGSRQNESAYTVRRHNARRGAVAWSYTSPADSSYFLQTMALSEAGTLHLGGTTGDGDTHLFAASLQIASGAVVFETVLRNIAPGIDIAIDNTVDQEGNIYVTGLIGTVARYMNVVGEHDIVTIKYSPKGELLWSKQYPLDKSSTVGAAVKKIAVDDRGGVYVSGSLRGDMLTLKYNAVDGELIWEAFHNTGEPGDYSSDIALDNEGGVYVTGYNIGPSSKIATIKYNAYSGNEEWVANYEKGGNTVAILVNNGLVYVAARSLIEKPGGGSDFDIVLIKYTATNGSEMSANIFDSGSSDHPSAMAMDNADGIYILGESATNFTGLHPFVIKFNAATGAEVWSSYTEAGIRAGGLATENAGGVFVVGYRGEEVVLAKFDAASGAKEWMKVESAGNIMPPKQTVVADAMNGVYVASTVAGGFKTSKFNTADGRLLWDVIEQADVNHLYGPAPHLSIALDNNQNVIVTGFHINSDNQDLDMLTVKYSQTVEEPTCAIPVNVQLYLAPYAIRAGWEARTTADFSPYILNEDTGLRWTWGDGSEPTMSYTAFGTARITGKHTYTRAGVYRVGLDFSESCLEPANGDYHQWHVIYDPEAGWVQGSGRLTLDGHDKWGNRHKGKREAEFSFSVRYQNRHATRPQGSLQLSVDGQRFTQSGVLDWLVITGDRAIWRGTAQLQGVGRFGYIVSVRDAGGKGKNDPGDQLRVRIWDLDRGNAVVFDNFEAGGDIYDLSGETGPRIAWGNIVINGKNKHSNLHATNAKGIQGIATASLQVYPNPASATASLRFALEEDDAYSVSLYDLKGALVQRVRQGQAGAGEAIEVQVDVSALPKGLYLLRLESTGYRESVKLIVTE